MLTRFYDLPMSNLIDKLFDIDTFNIKNNNFGAVNVREYEDKVILEFNIPGMKKEQVKINVEDGAIQVCGEKEENKETYSRKEFVQQSFCRKFKLPEDVNANDITAKHVDGILEIVMNRKKIEKTTGRVININ